MLSYLILTTRALTLASIVFGAASAFEKAAAPEAGRRLFRLLVLLGLMASIVIAWFRNATSLIDSAILNGWIYAVCLLTFLFFAVLSATPVRKSKKTVPSLVYWGLLGIQLFCVFAYALPEVWGYPYHVLMSEKTVISTDFLMSMIGMVLAIALMLVLYFAVKHSAACLRPGGACLFLMGQLLIHALLRLSGLFSVLFQKKIVKSNHTMFTYTVFVKNHSDWFIFASLALLILLDLILWLRSLRQKDPYTNPAEHRKVKARWRSIRRWAGAGAIGAVLSVGSLTVAEELNRTDVTLSPIEEASSMDEENIYVDFELVSDGHLHRFAYTTEDGTAIRFLIIQKPNSSAYGIGLDACDVCGETGYYEKDGQVVCNLCDVVMNISTIGFKGGCNPIVIPYEIKNGQIVLPISGLLEYEREFK